MPQLTSVNYLKLLQVLQEDDNIRTGDEWEAGDMGQPVGSCSCLCLGAVAPLDARLALGTGLTPQEQLTWDCNPGAGEEI